MAQSRVQITVIVATWVDPYAALMQRLVHGPLAIQAVIDFVRQHGVFQRVG